MICKYKKSGIAISLLIVFGFLLLFVWLYVSCDSTDERLGVLLLAIPLLTAFFAVIAKYSFLKINLKEDQLTLSGLTGSKIIKFPDIHNIEYSEWMIRLYDKDKRVLAFISDIQDLEHGQELKTTLNQYFQNQSIQITNPFLLFQTFQVRWILAISFILVSIGVYYHLYLSHILGVLVCLTTIFIFNKKKSWLYRYIMIMIVLVPITFLKSKNFYYNSISIYSYLGTFFLIMILAKHLKVFKELRK